MDGYRERRECPQPDEISEIFRRWRDFFGDGDRLSAP